MKEKILNFLMELGNDAGKLLMAFRAMIEIMTPKEMELLDIAEYEAEDNYVESKLSLPLPNCVRESDVPGGPAIEQVGGYIFQLSAWYEAAVSTGPDFVTRKQFLQDILEDLFVENGKTFFTPRAWFRFKLILIGGLKLIENFDGITPPEEEEVEAEPEMDPALTNYIKGENYFDELEARRAGWEF